MSSLGGELLEAFLVEGWDGLAEMEARVDALRAAVPGAAPATAHPDATHPDAPHHATLNLLAHRMRGSAGLYGFPQLAALAAVAERLTESRPQLSGDSREQLLDVLELIHMGLRRAMNDIGAGRGEGELGLYFAQVGGAARLQALLKVAGRAFAPRRSVRPELMLDPGELDAARPPTGAPGPEGTLDGELRAFRQENDEIWTYFAPEIREYLETLRHELEQGVHGDVAAMFRAAHTIKGSAFMVGFTALGQFAHGLEDLMSAVREQGLTLQGPASVLLSQGVTLMERMLGAAEGGATLPGAEVQALQGRMSALLSGEVYEGEPPPRQSGRPGVARAGHEPGPTLRVAQSIRVDTARLDAIMDTLGQLVMSRARLDRQLERLSRLEGALETAHARVARTVRDFEERYLNPDLERGTGAPDTDGAPARALGRVVQDLFEELEFDSYDDLNILARSVGELSADLSEVRQQFGTEHTALRAESDTFGKLLRSLRQDVTRTRRVPMQQAYTRPRRWARGQPQAELITLGGEQEVDALLTQGLGEVLMHLVTNAFTHAFTPGDAGQHARVLMGKPPLGRVTVAAQRRGTQLEVTVSDDGHGIGAAAVRGQALARGLRSARELDALNENETLQLIFLPGLSTAATLSTEAGRGVGMDIVASTVRRMSGELSVQSVAGEGTTFTVRLPLSQQVTDVLTVGVGPHLLGFPAAAVGLLREVQPGELISGEGGKATRLTDGTPLHFLQPLWNEPSPHLQPGGFLNVVMLVTPQGPVGFVVDRFCGIAEAVVSVPGPLLSSLPYVSGVTVTPDGEPVLLPDVQNLTRQAERVASSGALSVPGPAARRQRRLLLVDDSLSVRRVVSRMLERAGYAVLTASDGQEALDLLREHADVQAVLTDLEMPRANGFEVIEEVRRRGLSVPVVVMTTRAGEKHQRLAFQLGANDYFSKPVDEALLTRCLDRLLSGAEAAEAGAPGSRA